MFVIVELETVLNAEFVGMFILYLSANFQMSKADGSFITAIKPKGKCSRPVYISCSPQCFTFFKHLLLHIISDLHIKWR